MPSPWLPPVAHVPPVDPPGHQRARPRQRVTGPAGGEHGAVAAPLVREHPGAAVVHAGLGDFAGHPASCCWASWANSWRSVSHGMRRTPRGPTASRPPRWQVAQSWWWALMARAVAAARAWWSAVMPRFAFHCEFPGVYGSRMAHT